MRTKLTTNEAFELIVKDPTIARRTAARFWCKVDTSAGPDGCWPWTGCMPSRAGMYGRFGLSGSVVGDAHRVAFVLASHKLPERDMVCHHCDNPICVNPGHLYDGFVSENARDMVVRGRHRPFRGRLEANPNAKLTQSKADAIRAALKEGIKAKCLALTYGVSVSTIYRIADNSQWPSTASNPTTVG